MSPGVVEPGASAPAVAPAPAGGLGLWPWLLAAIALGAGGAFLLWRRNTREAFAGDVDFDRFVAPEPAPEPRRSPVADQAPAPLAAPPISEPVAPAPSGLVSTRLRPWIDVTVTPSRCIVENDQVTFEFEAILTNTGTALARDVLLEATMVNASPTQESEISAFFNSPAGVGERITLIEPLGRVGLRPKIVVPRDRLRVLDAGGRRVFVPLIAFNALYRWGDDERQTSMAYLVGRETGSNKLAPFRLDLGPRVFRGLESRPLEMGVRV